MTLFQTTTMAKVGCDGTDGQRLRQHLPGVRQCSDNRDRGNLVWGLAWIGKKEGVNTTGDCVERWIHTDNNGLLYHLYKLWTCGSDFPPLQTHDYDGKQNTRLPETWTDTGQDN